MDILWPRQEVPSGGCLLRTLEGGGVTSGTEVSSSRSSSMVSEGEAMYGESLAMALMVEEAKGEADFAVEVSLQDPVKEEAWMEKVYQGAWFQRRDR